MTITPPTPEDSTPTTPMPPATPAAQATPIPPAAPAAQEHPTAPYGAAAPAAYPAYGAAAVPSRGRRTGRIVAIAAGGVVVLAATFGGGMLAGAALPHPGGPGGLRQAGDFPRGGPGENGRLHRGDGQARPNGQSGGEQAPGTGDGTGTGQDG